MVIFGVYYRSNVSNHIELEPLSTEILIMTNRYPNSDFVLCGDFNLPDINWAERKASARFRQDEYLDMFSEYNLTQIVDRPTRGNNLLDLVFLSEENSLFSVEVGAPLGSSDHNVVHVKLNKPACAGHDSKNLPTGYSWSKANWTRMRNLLGEVNWWEFFSENDLQDVNRVWHKFKQKIISIIDITVPQKSINSLSRHQRSQRALRAIKAKRKAHRRYLRTRDDSDKSLYRDAVKHVGRVLRDDKRKLDNNVVRSGSFRKFYSFLNSKLNHKPKTYSLKIGDSGKVSTDENEIIGEFSEYFSTVFSPLPDAIPVFCSNGVHEMPDFVVSSLDIINAVLLCPDKTSVGIDRIPYAVYKQCVGELVLPLQIIFSLSLNTGKLPDDWKVSIVSPIHKKGSRLSAKNYRPISLTVVACRIFERLLRDHIY